MTHFSSAKPLSIALSTLSLGLLVACSGAESPQDEAGSGGTPNLPATGGVSSTGGASPGGEASSGGSGLGAASNGTGGGVSDPAPYCDTETKLSVPYAVTEDFIASGYMGDTEDITMAGDTCPDRPDGASGSCFTVEYTPAGSNGWAGVTWQYPQDNWGTEPGLCFNSSAKYVKFKAKGAAGGEKVGFAAAGAKSGDLTLTTTWTEYSITLGSDFNLSGDSGGVAQGFTWSAAAPEAKITFYLDDIRWAGE